MAEHMKDPNFYGGASPVEQARLIDYIAATTTPEESFRVDLTRHARQWVEDNDAAPSLTVRCSSKYRKKPCRRLIARVWTSPRTDGGASHYFRAEIRTFPEARMAKLEGVVMPIREAGGMPTAAAIAERVALQESTEYDGILQCPVPGLDGGVLLGCVRHSNVAVYSPYLIERADSTRPVLNVDTMRKHVGYPRK